MARAQRRRARSSSRSSGESGLRRARREATSEAAANGAAAPAVPQTTTTTPRVQPQRRRWNPFGFLKRFEPRFVADIVSELRKVTWPSFAETRYLTFVVALVAILMGIILGSFDLLFGWIIERLFFS